ncbi:uncharacterized protein LOC117967216 isoform X2 [Acipenser ruthenus]|nr:uncharacterized protein LOC117967216 isoform X2 [Acipenser ruthenus]XP_058873645.1 uncharacterized protein LOC117967216 isoform X2 [Acipenser ruthenus]
MPFSMKRQRKQQRKYYLNRLQKARMNQLHSKEVSEIEAAHISPELPIRWVVSADRTVEIKEEVTELGCDQANERILQEETPPSSITERGTDVTLVSLGRRQESEMASSHIKEEAPELEPVLIKEESPVLEPVLIKEESPVLQPVLIKKEVTVLEPDHNKEESPVLESSECEHLSASKFDEGEHDSTPSPQCKNSKCKSRQNRNYKISGRCCRFKEVWKQEPEYRNWLAEVNNCVHRAFCKYCRKSFDVGNMGVSALKSHMRGQGHAKAAAQLEKYEPIITSFFTFQNKETQSDQRSRTAAPIGRPSGEGMDEGTSTVPHASSSVSSFVLSDRVLEAEIRWAVKVVLSRYSFNSCTDVPKLFSSMFPDSDIAQHFSCSATKCAYLVCFGLAPYFKERLIEEVRLSNCYAVSFNVCLNEVTQTDQVDLVISYWNEKDGKVAVRYLGSEFLGHTRAEELLESFKWSLTPLDPKKLLHMAMDGPRVNWKFLRDLEVDRKEEDPTLPDLINLGSCGLHVVHSSLQYGANETGWMLGELLGALWQLFHDTPAWRDDYTQITGSTRFPLKFCPHRWVEDLKVAERALELWPNVIQFIDVYKKLPVSKVPNSASYSLVKQAAADPLCAAKLQFFASVARQLKPFLEKFQTNAPMLPFLAEEFQALLSSLLSRFIKKDVLGKANTVIKLLKIDPLDKTLHVAHKHLDLSFATNRALEQASEKLADGLRGTEFKMECITFLASTTKKLLEINPLLNPMVRYLAALSPRFMVMSEQDATAKFERLLQILLNAKWHTAAQCEVILAAYTLFLTEMIRNHKTEFQNFGQNDSEPCRADEFFGRFFDGRPEFKKLWDLFKLLLTLSHGQTAVEQGHSVNKDMFVENLKEKTIVAQHIVRDSLSSLGENHTDLAITKKLLQHVKAAKMRYVQFLEDQKKAKTETEKERKRKKIQDEIAGVQKKRRKVLKIISTMQKVADEMAELAEKKHDFTLLTKSNAYRKSAKEKSNETAELDAKLSELKDKAKYFD